MELLSTPEFLPWAVGMTLLAVSWGACIGSFLNVCVHRMPRDLSVVKPRSFCPKCGRLIPGYFNIPIISYIMLRAKCAYCKSPIRPRYVLIEAFTALLFLLIWLKTPLLAWGQGLHLIPLADTLAVPVLWLFVSGLIVGTFIDLEYMIIPDSITWGGMLAGLIASFAIPSLQNETNHTGGLVMSLMGLVVGGGSLWLVSIVGRWIFRKDAMGLGDVKLLAAIGAFLGWRAVLFTIMASSLLGSIIGVILILCKGRQMSSRIPFGPYLAFAAVLWVLWGPLLWQGYINLLTPEP
jgi:leader peptidase (prepilin peptidase)/N-methyltransferase